MRRLRNRRRQRRATVARCGGATRPWAAGACSAAVAGLCARGLGNGRRMSEGAPRFAGLTTAAYLGGRRGGVREPASASLLAWRCGACCFPRCSSRLRCRGWLASGVPAPFQRGTWCSAALQPSRYSLSALPQEWWWPRAAVDTACPARATASPPARRKRTAACALCAPAAPRRQSCASARPAEAGRATVWPGEQVGVSAGMTGRAPNRSGRVGVAPPVRLRVASRGPACRRVRRAPPPCAI